MEGLCWTGAMSGHPDERTESGAQCLGKKIGLCACIVHANVSMKGLAELGQSDEFVRYQERD